MRDRIKYEQRIGTIVDGRWRVDGLLGWGSTSAVYDATHRNGHRAALKILHQSLCTDKGACERFLREAGIANGIKHHAVVPVRDDGITEEGCAYLVLELLEGETLEERRERKGGHLGLEEAAPLAAELFEAITAVHVAGVVHRDLKPLNVFITTSGEVKLLDFGTARILDPKDGSNVSVEGLVIGTPSFMSPEQARGARAEIDPRSDVWSLGATLFTVLSGEFVHAGRDAHARLLAAASKPARSVSEVAPWVDARVALVIDRALAQEKNDRWPDVATMAVAFRRAVLASLPTLRGLQASDDVLGDPEAALAPVPTSSHTPSFATAQPITFDDAGLTSEAPGVSATQALRVPRVKFSALVVAVSVMGLLVLGLVVFAVTGNDVPDSRAAAASKGESSQVAPPPAIPIATIPPPAVVIIEPSEPPAPTVTARAPVSALPPAPIALPLATDAGAVVNAPAQVKGGSGIIRSLDDDSRALPHGDMQP